MPNNKAAPSNSTGSRNWPSARSWLLLYLASVVGITFIHQSSVLAILLAGVFIASGSLRWTCMRRTIRAVLVFNLTVSVGYTLVSSWQGAFIADYLLLANLRVILLMYFGFWFIMRINLLSALAGCPTPTLIAVLAISQIKSFERILNDFRAAFESRNISRPHFMDRSRHTAAQIHTLLDKSLASSTEVALAMRSRGAFDD